MKYGFLPDEAPLAALPSSFTAWENLANHLPKFLLSDEFKKSILSLSPFPVDELCTEQQDERAMQILSYLGHAYVWGSKEIPKSLPTVLAKPWFAVAQKLGRHPVLSYASYALHNWRKLDPQKPVALGNIALIQNFLGGVDEEWFILVHVDIEAKANSMMEHCVTAVKATQEKNAMELLKSLQNIATIFTNICNTLDRMPERCDPHIYYHRVRPYIHGWKNHPALPQGLIYEGVDSYQNKPQQFRGETGAQSSIIPTLDGLLGITHANDELRQYLLEMREYMPPAHRDFIRSIETQSQVREFVKNNYNELPQLRDIYNQCIKLIERFRQSHLAYAASYIQKQFQETAGNPNAVGTGGTPFMQYLKKHKDETASFLL